MAAAAILKIGSMAISRSLWLTFARNFTQGLKVKTVSHTLLYFAIKINFPQFQDGAI